MVQNKMGIPFTNMNIFPRNKTVKLLLYIHGRRPTVNNAAFVHSQKNK